MSRDIVWLTVAEAAERTRYSVRTIERYIACQRLVSYRGPGGHVRLRSDDVDGLFQAVTP